MRFKLKIIWFLFSLKLNKWLYKKNLKRLQGKRYSQLLKTLRYSPFYSIKIKKSESLGNLPIINKSLFMRHFDEINTKGIKLKDAVSLAVKAEEDRNFAPMIDGITIGLSTGTSGNRGVFLASETERAKWVAGVLDRVIGFSLKQRKVAFFLRANSNLYQSVNSRVLKFHFFDLLKSQSENIARLHELNPHILVAQASMLCVLAKAQLEGKLRIAPQKIISVAEVLTKEDQEFLSSVFGQTIHQVYQCTEGFLASTCSKGVLHFNEDFLIIEKNMIEGQHNKFYPIITDLWRTTQPVIRYELNDIVVSKEKCECGSMMMAIEKIEGRSDDILTFVSDQQEEVDLFPDLFRRAIVLSDAGIEDYAIIQKSERIVELYVMSKDDHSYNRSVESVLKVFQDYNISDVRIERLFSNPQKLGEKKRRVKNEFRKAR